MENLVNRYFSRSGSIEFACCAAGREKMYGYAGGFSSDAAVASNEMFQFVLSLES